jgi:hypothetical protein
MPPKATPRSCIAFEGELERAEILPRMLVYPACSPAPGVRSGVAGPSPRSLPLPSREIAKHPARLLAPGVRSGVAGG